MSSTAQTKRWSALEASTTGVRSDNMKKTDQIFFRKDEESTAFQQLDLRRNELLFALVDKRSKNPKPLMFVLCSRGDMNNYVFPRMHTSNMLKRMWTFKLWVTR